MTLEDKLQAEKGEMNGENEHAVDSTNNTGIHEVRPSSLIQLRSSQTGLIATLMIILTFD